MNNKGFAISVILYSIIFLVITIMFMLLGIVRTRYTVNEKLREKVINEIDDIEVSLDESNYSCTINASSDDYDPDLILRIDVDSDDNLLYSFDGENYGNSNEIKASHSGTYMGYFKDLNDNIGSCSVELTSKTVYSYQECSKENKIYGIWYQLGKTKYVNNCTPYSKNDAERNNGDWYRTCDNAGNSQGYVQDGVLYTYTEKLYRRDATGCNWENETSTWYLTDDYVASKVTKQVVPKTAYKIR